jgi:radical SAM protein with 4Fe4S-binding SPASM domain
MKDHYIHPKSRGSITKHVDKATLVNPSLVNPDGSVGKGTIEGVKFELDNICNLNCLMCGRNVDETPSKMDWGLFTKMTREMKDFGVQSFGPFFGNESFINIKRTTDAISFLKNELGVPRVFITTNGTLGTKRNVEACISAGLDSLKWSVNWSDNEQFGKVTRRNPSLFNNILQNIKDAYEVREQLHREQGISCGLFASSIKFHDEQITFMKPLLEKHVFPYIDEWYMLPEYQMGGGKTVDRIQKAGFDDPIAGNTGRVGAERHALPCWTIMNASHVKWNGDMLACCFPAPNKDMIMGNLHEQSFEEIINGPKYRALRLAHLNQDVTGTACENCLAYS